MKNNRNFRRNSGVKKARESIKPIRLSQCMIVKDEEKNIEKALSWAKDIAFEQIVVDTGSTDRTVEIAERMGATVYHFEWINDFAAAKNFAIEQATGNWIAFLDADEYLLKEDAEKLVELLSLIERDPNPDVRQCETIRCPWVQIDDKGEPFLLLVQERIFRNIPNVRYKNKIHETLTLSKPAFSTDGISIFHTGYAKSVYAETNKTDRNITMLKAELETNPDDANLKCYLSDSLRATGRKENKLEAARLYKEALSSGQTIFPMLKQSAYSFLITDSLDDEEQKKEALELCYRAIEDFPQNADYEFYCGCLVGSILEKHDEAWEHLKKCEDILGTMTLYSTGMIATQPEKLFFQMLATAVELGDDKNTIHYATLVLREDKYQNGVLTPLLTSFRTAQDGTGADEVFDLLSKLYDFSDTKDKLTVLTCAKAAGYPEIFERVLSLITKEEYEWLTEKPVGQAQQ